MRGGVDVKRTIEAMEDRALAALFAERLRKARVLNFEELADALDRVDGRKARSHAH
jgi:hypothetical protein